MPGIVEGRRWVRARIQFLEGLLREEPPGEQRKAIEAEISALQPERKRGWLRWMFPRPPHDL